MSTLLQKRDVELVKKIDARVCNEYGINSSHLHSRARDKKVSHARFIIWIVLRGQFDWHFEKIAEAYNRDHTTVISGINMGVKLGLDSEAKAAFTDLGYPQFPRR